jgi:hypothetical protein
MIIRLCEESKVLKVKVPLICPSTVGVPARREGQYRERLYTQSR